MLNFDLVGVKANLEFTVKLPEIRVGRLAAVIGSINVVFLLGMHGFLSYYRALPDWESAPGIKYLYTQFNLATENVVASWYSSMLLLLAALMAMRCFKSDWQADRRRLSSGWIILAGIFALLSFDEMGSMHERAGIIPLPSLGGDQGLGWVTVLAIPIALVAVYMVVFGWLRMRRVPWAMVGFGAGIVLFIGNPVLEHLEMGLLLVNDDAAMARHDDLLLLEEGSEIFGSLCFIVALAIYASGRRPQGDESDVTTVRTRACLWGAVALVVVLDLVLIAGNYAQRKVYLVDSGAPTNWSPSALSALASGMFLVLSGNCHEAGRRVVYRVMSLYCLLMSMYYGAFLKYWLAPVLGRVDMVLVVVAAVLAIFLGLGGRWLSRLAMVAWVMALGYAMATNHGAGGHRDVLALGALLFATVAFLAGHPSSATRFSRKGA